MRSWLKWLTLATLVCACATATATSGSEAAHSDSTFAAAAGPDTDHDGLSDDAEVRRYHTDLRKRDTDRDGLIDGAEVLRYKTNPRKPDSDRDGLGDGAEVGRYHTNPRSSDTDHDGLTDSKEIGTYHTGSRFDVTRTATGMATASRSRKGTDPRDPAESARFPARGQHRRASRNVADGIHGPRDDLDAEYGDRREADQMHPGKRAGSGDPQLEDLVRWLLRRRELRGEYFSGTPLLLEDSEVDCRDPGGTAIVDSNITVRRVNIHGCENGFNIESTSSWRTATSTTYTTAPKRIRTASSSRPTSSARVPMRQARST